MAQLRNVLILFISLKYTLGQEENLWCYECGTGIAGEADCQVFALATSWRPFWRQCPGDSVCVKTISGLDIKDELHAVRGCTPKVSLAGSVHQDGCWTHRSTSTITCYCTKNLCNTAHTRMVLPTSLMLVNSLLILVFTNYCV